MVVLFLPTRIFASRGVFLSYSFCSYICAKQSKMTHILDILKANWLMSGEAYRNLFDAVLPMLRAGNADKIDSMLSASGVMAYATTPYLASQYELDDASLPEASVAVIKLSGPLYSWDTYRVEHLLQVIETNQRITGVVLWIDGPGGMATHVDVVAKQIHEFSKPVATYVAGEMSSAHFWLGCAAARIFVSSPMSELGSVGCYTTYISLKKYYSEMGVDIRDIYPDSSDLKNIWYRDIEERNDEKRVKESLADLHRFFCESVSEFIGIPYDSSLPLFRGELFTGRQAVEEGYAHQFGNLQDAAQWVLAQSVIRKTA